VVNLVNLKPEEKVQSSPHWSMNEEADSDKFIMLATKDGLVKKDRCQAL
jgi:hypothetical protein